LKEEKKGSGPFFENGASGFFSGPTPSFLSPENPKKVRLTRKKNMMRIASKWEQ